MPNSFPVERQQPATDQSLDLPLTPEAQREIDKQHGTTGWSAFDVWRSRVLVPLASGYNQSRGKPR